MQISHVQFNCHIYEVPRMWVDKEASLSSNFTTHLVSRSHHSRRRKYRQRTSRNRNVPDLASFIRSYFDICISWDFSLFISFWLLITRLIKRKSFFFFVI